MWYVHWHWPRSYKKLAPLLKSTLVSSFGLGMVGVFGPVFIYHLFDEWWMGIVGLIGYVVVARVVSVALLPLAVSSLERIGYRGLMAVAMTSQVLVLWGMAAIPWIGNNGLWWIAILEGIYIATYFLAYHGLFLADHDIQRTGEQMGLLVWMTRMAMVAGPLVGGLIVAWWGFVPMFLVGSLCVLCSLIPLQKMAAHRHVPEKRIMKRAIELVQREAGFGWTIGSWMTEQVITNVLWPVYVALMVGGYGIFGGIMSMAMFVSGLIAYLAGRGYDKGVWQRYHKLITGWFMVSWALRWWAPALPWLWAADVSGRMAGPSWWMRLRKAELLVGEREDPVVFSVAHELMVSAGMVVGLLVAGSVLLMSGGQWGWLLPVTWLGIVSATWGVQRMRKT